jgi:hypothetical protein
MNLVPLRPQLIRLNLKQRLRKKLKRSLKKNLRRTHLSLRNRPQSPLKLRLLSLLLQKLNQMNYLQV